MTTCDVALLWLPIRMFERSVIGIFDGVGLKCMMIR
jgi:hypothetical protein